MYFAILLTVIVC